MKLTSKSVVVGASQTKVWQKLIDWQAWPTWDGGMETISFKTPVQLGAVGRLKMKGGPTVDLRVTEYTFEKSYTSEFDLWGSRFVFIHYLDSVMDNAPKVRATVKVEAYGFSAPLVGALVRYGLNKEMLGWLERLKDLIETGSP
jgi:hypothetical protein